MSYKIEHLDISSNHVLHKTCDMEINPNPEYSYTIKINLINDQVLYVIVGSEMSRKILLALTMEEDL